MRASCPPRSSTKPESPCSESGTQGHDTARSVCWRSERPAARSRAPSQVMQACPPPPVNRHRTTHQVERGRAPAVRREGHKARGRRARQRRRLRRPPQAALVGSAGLVHGGEQERWWGAGRAFCQQAANECGASAGAAVQTRRGSARCTRAAREHAHPQLLAVPAGQLQAARRVAGKCLNVLHDTQGAALLVCGGKAAVEEQQPQGRMRQDPGAGRCMQPCAWATRMRRMRRVHAHARDAVCAGAERAPGGRRRCYLCCAASKDAPLHAP